MMSTLEPQVKVMHHIEGVPLLSHLFAVFVKHALDKYKREANSLFHVLYTIIKGYTTDTSL